MIQKIHSWFKQLSTIAKVGVVSGTGIALMTAGQAFAGEPVISYQNTEETEEVPFAVTLQDDDNMLVTDPHQVITAGKKGSKTVTYRVKYEDGTPTKERTIIKEAVLSQPITQIEKAGTKEVVTITEKESVPFGNENRNDSTLAKGTSTVTTAGANGEKNVTYQVTKIKGTEVSRTKTSETITVQPIAQITTVGTKVTSNCDSNYSGACVPIASDVDCGSGSGNGPAYLYGTARVVGYDIYDLDRDGNGLACE